MSVIVGTRLFEFWLLLVLFGFELEIEVEVESEGLLGGGGRKSMDPSFRAMCPSMVIPMKAVHFHLRG